MGIVFMTQAYIDGVSGLVEVDERVEAASILKSSAHLEPRNARLAEVGLFSYVGPLSLFHPTVLQSTHREKPRWP
jgi:hypothetical protein